MYGGYGGNDTSIRLARQLAEQRAGRQREDETDEQYEERVQACQPTAEVDNAHSQRKRDLAGENGKV